MLRESYVVSKIDLAMKALSHKTEDLSIADVSSDYPDQWVVVEITGRDKYGWHT
jgi:hypothetical protein